MEEQASFIWLVIALPILGFLIQAFFGKAVVRRLGPARGKSMMGTLAVLPIALAFVIGLVITMRLGQQQYTERSVVVTLGSWIELKNLSIPFEFLIDPLSMTMVLIITGIGSLIHLYATGYMAEEKDYSRFFTYLNLFIAFMLVLVTANNLVLLFVGWEGVGLCSYLLIGFWYKDLNNSRAANKAFIVNRIGDWGLTLGMFLLVSVLASNLGVLHETRLFSYDVISSVGVHAIASHPFICTVIALLLFVGACGKSAQFPLYLWLPDAMAGPTPVSALIHAATMVTAGVFMLNRLHLVFELSPAAGAVIAMVGAFTATFAALIAFGQTDIKKVLAYSTVSQLGFMFIACGAGAYWAGMFHVTTHAFFKALLFLGSGAVIHAMAHNQDMRNYGKLSKYLKITCWTMVVGWLAISGVPFLSGFYSKEAILGSAMASPFANYHGLQVAYYAGWVGLGAALLTAFYMTRMMMQTFWGKEERWRSIPAQAEDHGHHEHVHHAHEHHDHGPDVHGFFMSDEQATELAEEPEHHHELDQNHKPHEVPVSMWFPLVVLAILSAVGGFALAYGERFHNWLYPESSLSFIGRVPEHAEGIPLMWLSIGAALGGIALGLFFYWKGLPAKEGWDESKWSRFRLSAREQFGYDALAVDTSVKGGTDLGLALWAWFDSRVVDGAVNGVAGLAAWIGSGLRQMQTGYARFYALMMLAGGVGILGYFAYVISQVGGVK